MDRTQRYVAKIEDYYRRGILTRPEVVGKLMHLAAEAPPADLAAAMSADWLAELRQDCERLTAPPPGGGMFIFTSSCSPTAEDAEQARREFEDSWRAGLAAWRAFFHAVGMPVQSGEEVNR